MRKSPLGFIIIVILFLSVPVSNQNTTDSDLTSTESLIQQGEIGLQEITATSFVSKWDTTLTSTGSSASNQVMLPIYDGGMYDFEVDWGDTNVETIDSYTEATHTYSSEGEQYIIDTYSWTITDGGINEMAAPVLSNPDDMSFEYGSTGNQIQWSGSSSNPHVYEVILDGVLFETGSWEELLISIDIDGLAVDNHEFIVTVYDIFGNMASDVVTVTVTEITAPDISSPADISYEEGSTNNSIVWTVGDANPEIYEITMDGAIYEEGTWINGTISIGIDGFLAGLYIFTLCIYDIDGNKAVDSVIITVTEPPAEDVTETVTETITKTDQSNDTITDTTTDTVTDTVTTILSEIPTELTNTEEGPLFLPLFIISFGLLVIIRRRRT